MFAPATNWPSRSVSSAITSPEKPTGPSDPPLAPKAARISSSVDGRDSPGNASYSFISLSRSSPRTSASTTVPSAFVTGIAFDVAATSMPRKSASDSHVVMPGVTTSSAETSVSGNVGTCGHRLRDVAVRGVVAIFTTHQYVLARARRREEVDAELPAHDPALGLNVVRLELAAGEDLLVRLAVRLEAPLDALVVAVERVGVLHDELADAEEASAAGAARSRSLTEKWYQSCGSCLYDWISRAWNVTVSSCVGARR